MSPPLIYLISLAVNLAQLVSTSVALPAELVDLFVLVNNPANSFAFHHFYNCNALQDSIRSANNSVNGFSAILVFAGTLSVKFRFRPEFRLDIEIRFLPEPD